MKLINDLIESKSITPQKASIQDLALSAGWCASYELNEGDEDMAQALFNTINFLEIEIAKRIKAKNLATAKRAYAKEHGLKISQVRVKN